MVKILLMLYVNGTREWILSSKPTTHALCFPFKINIPFLPVVGSMGLACHRTLHVSKQQDIKWCCMEVVVWVESYWIQVLWNYRNKVLARVIKMKAETGKISRDFLNQRRRSCCDFTFSGKEVFFAKYSIFFHVAPSSWLLNILCGVAISRYLSWLQADPHTL